MSFGTLKKTFETLTKGPPVYDDILALGRSINKSAAQATNRRSKLGFKGLKSNFNSFTKNELFSKHKKEYANTVSRTNHRRTIRRSGPGIKSSVLNSIRKSVNPQINNFVNRTASRLRASRRRASRKRPYR
jgi:hypothetical protein